MQINEEKLIKSISKQKQKTEEEENEQWELLNVLRRRIQKEIYIRKQEKVNDIYMFVINIHFQY